MRVFKFGGASIGSVERIQNLSKILSSLGTSKLLLVVSAKGKTTNSLEEILGSFLKKEGNYKNLLSVLEESFKDFTKELFTSPSEMLQIIEEGFEQLENTLQMYKGKPYNEIYDQVVSYGELLTSQLIAAYLKQEGLENTLLDARKYIRTDASYRDAKPDWKLTQQKIEALKTDSDFYITQGFIAGNARGATTTLGREGSDYSAAIFAYCLDAAELVIWKDVEGVLNADPRHFEKTTLLEQVSFNEAIELAYYGASIIHPKTIQPLHSKKIPLRVRSFLDMEASGTLIQEGKRLVPDVPCYILKQKQQLLKIASREFSFIVEEDISDIFRTLCDCQMKVNLLHNSAISLSLCIDDRLGDIQECIRILEEKYQVTLLEDVTLYTVRNYDEIDFQKRFGKLKPLLRQTKDDVVHIIVENRPCE